MEAGRERHAQRRRQMARIVAGVLGLGLCVGGCSQTADPDIGVATEEELARLADRVDALEDQLADARGRLADLEDGPPDADEDPTRNGPGTADPTEGFLDDRESAIGDRVTLRATVADVIPTTSLGTAFRIAGRSGDPVPVLAATPTDGLDPDDVVEVTGAVVRVDPDAFEGDFGIDAGQLLEDPAGFFEESEGRIALSATDVAIIQDEED